MLRKDDVEFALTFAEACRKMRMAYDLNMEVTLSDEENKSVIRTLQLLTTDTRAARRGRKR